MSKFSDFTMDIFDGENAAVMDVTNGKNLYIQAVGSGTCKVLARLNPNTKFAPIMAIGLHDLKPKSEITDENIYTADVTGLYSVTVQATGFDSVQACATL